MLYKRTDDTTWYSDARCRTGIESLTTLPTYTDSVFAGCTYQNNACITKEGDLLADANCNVTVNTTLACNLVGCLDCNPDSTVSDCSFARVVANQCQYTYTCADGYYGSGVSSVADVHCTGNVLMVHLYMNGGTIGGSTLMPALPCTYGGEPVYVDTYNPTCENSTFVGWQRANGTTTKFAIACDVDALGVTSGSASIKAIYECEDGYTPNADGTACVMAQQATCTNGSTHYDDGLCLYASNELYNNGTMPSMPLASDALYSAIKSVCSTNGYTGEQTMENINAVYASNRYEWINSDEIGAGYISTQSNPTAIFPKSQCAIPVLDTVKNEVFIVRNNTWWAPNAQNSYLSYDNGFADYSLALLGMTSSDFKSNAPAYDMMPYDKTARVFTNLTGVTFNRGAKAANAIADDPNTYIDLVIRKSSSTVTLPDWDGVMTKYLTGKPENCTLTGINSAADGNGNWYWRGGNWTTSDLYALDNLYSGQIGAIPMYMIWNCQ